MNASYTVRWTDPHDDGAYKSLVDVEYATAGWVEWYNNRRLHSAINWQSPAAFEDAHYAALNPEEQFL